MRCRRFAIGAAAALAVAMTPMAALAHAALVSTSPAVGDTLEVAPEAVTLVFDGELVPDGTGLTVTDPDGVVVGEGELDLTVADRNQVAGRVEISEPGTYSVAWTALAADGHEEEGEFVFTVSADAASPNTAMAAAAHLPSALGAILLLIAIQLALRRVRRTTW